MGWPVCEVICLRRGAGGGVDMPTYVSPSSCYQYLGYQYLVLDFCKGGGGGLPMSSSVSASICLPGTQGLWELGGGRSVGMCVICLPRGGVGWVVCLYACFCVRF